jgi:hypothetical protein
VILPAAGVGGGPGGIPGIGGGNGSGGGSSLGGGNGGGTGTPTPPPLSEAPYPEGASEDGLDLEKLRESHRTTLTTFDNYTIQGRIEFRDTTFGPFTCKFGREASGEEYYRCTGDSIPRATGGGFEAVGVDQYGSGGQMFRHTTLPNGTTRYSSQFSGGTNRGTLMTTYLSSDVASFNATGTAVDNGSVLMRYKSVNFTDPGITGASRQPP